MSLRRLLPEARFVGCRRLEVSGCSADSRRLDPGQVFVAVRGARHDGHDFVARALERGATGVVVERSCPEAGRPQVVVPDTRRAPGPGRPGAGRRPLRATGDPRRDRDGRQDGRRAVPPLDPGGDRPPRRPDRAARLVRRRGGPPAGPVRARTPGRWPRCSRRWSNAAARRRWSRSPTPPWTAGRSPGSPSPRPSSPSSAWPRRRPRRGPTTSPDGAALLMQDVVDRGRGGRQRRRPRRRPPGRREPVGPAVDLRHRAARRHHGPDRPARRHRHEVPAPGVRPRGRGRDPADRHPCRRRRAGGVGRGAGPGGFGRAVVDGLRAVAVVPGRLEPVAEGQPFEVRVDQAGPLAELRRALSASRDSGAGRLLCVLGAEGHRDRPERLELGRAAEIGSPTSSS